MSASVRRRRRRPDRTDLSTRDVLVSDPDGYRLVSTTPDFGRMRDFETTMRGVQEP
ncbi:hypothetical protein [Methanoculleus caldifontis]|uniref:hypothetical protein n=1 Tax=Methanoculleus caldifontis TaxID=2651577 RepID=UPI0029373AF0|nr:hypothetical protein [Methanoculleus sp. Wushi-C6]